MAIDCDDSSDETNCSTNERFYCENNDPLFVDIKKASYFKKKYFLKYSLLKFCLLLVGLPWFC